MPFSLYDFRDLDLMLKIADEGDNKGWVETRKIAESMGIPEEERITGLGTRLAWMRRFGMLEKNNDVGVWRLSRGGERVADAKLRAAATRQIDSIPEEALIDTMAHVTARYRHGDRMVAEMLMREFRFGTHVRSRVWGDR